jgi:DNA-binding response OmpR family regulator
MWKILLVDDEPRDHAMLSIMLPQDFTLLSCFTGGEALEFIPREKPDLVLLDVKLPDINGIEVLKSVKLTKERPAFIMVSGFDDTNLVVEAIKAGALHYLVKPYTFETLLTTVRDSLMSW